MTSKQAVRAAQGPRDARMRTCALTRLWLLATLLPVNALLLAAPVHAADSLTQTMRVSKDELATPEGRQAARARAGVIAARLCREFRDTRTVANRETYAACTRDATASAMAQIDTAVAQAQASATAQATAPASEPAPRRVADN